MLAEISAATKSRDCEMSFIICLPFICLYSYYSYQKKTKYIVCFKTLKFIQLKFKKKEGKLFTNPNSALLLV